MKKTYIYLGIILIIACILRFWALGAIPSSPDWDEVALGYNAYSILHTGKDEYGAVLPFVLRSFGDYKPALYSYLTIPSVAVFGLTVFAARFPSAVMGVLGVLLMYFFVKELFGEYGNKQNKTGNYAEILALVSAFLLAISPWQIQFSRTAFETNTGLTFNLLVGFFFLKGLKKPWMLSLAALFAGLNLAVYQSERVFTPLLVVALVIIYWRELFAVSKKYLSFAIVVGLLAVLPTALFIITNSSSLERAEGTSIFSEKTQAVQDNVTRLANDTKNHDVIGMVIDNRRVIYIKEIIGGYLSHFDPNWLFVEGDNDRHHPPDMGIMYLLDLPFLLIGIYFFIFGNFGKKIKSVVVSWLFLAPVPASVTFDVPHAVRTMNMLPMLLILAAIGYIAFFQLLLKKQNARHKDQIVRIIVICVFVFCAIWNFAYYLNQYFVQLNYFDAPDWQYGYQQAIGQIEKIQGNYKKVVVSNKTPMDQSYIFFLFYLEYPPQQYQKLALSGQNLGADKHFDKYEFRTIDWGKDKNKKDILYVGAASDFPTTINPKVTIANPDGTPAILLVDPKDNL